MPAQDSQQHCKRIDRCVTDVRCFRIAEAVCKRKRRRVGCSTSKHTAKREVIDLEHRLANNHHNHQREECDNRRERHVVETVAIQEHIEELDTGIEAHAAEEYRNAEFTEHEVRTVRHEEVERAHFAFAAKDNRDNQRTASKAELEQSRHARNRHRNATDNHAEENAEECGENFRMVKFTVQKSTWHDGFVGLNCTLVPG